MKFNANNFDCALCSVRAAGYCDTVDLRYGDPPCAAFTEFEDDEELAKHLEEMDIAQTQARRKYDLEKKAKEEKKRLASEKRKASLEAYKQRNKEDLKAISCLKSMRKILEKQLKETQKQTAYLESINEVNRMFRECNSSCPEDVPIDKHIEERILKSIHDIDEEISRKKYSIYYKEKSR